MCDNELILNLGILSVAFSLVLLIIVLIIVSNEFSFIFIIDILYLNLIYYENFSPHSMSQKS